jgi:ABC-type branched-subunit amino acid transport system substrate-binding protein
VFYSSSAPGSADGTNAGYTKDGFQIVAQVAVPPTQTDFTSDILRMKSEGVNYVSILLAAQQSASVINQIGAQGWTPIMNGGGSQYSASFLKLLNPGAGTNLVQDLWVANYLGGDAKTVPGVKLFLTWMQKTHPTYPVDELSLLSFAEAELFVQALKNAGQNPTRASLKAALDKITNFTAGGLVAPADPAATAKTHRGPTCWMIVKLTNRKWQRVTPASGYDCKPGGWVS